MALLNMTVNIPGLVTSSEYAPKFIYVINKVHAIDLIDIVLILLVYAFIVYYWIKVNKNKEYYEKKWVNPSGRQVNLYKIVQIFIILYPIVVIILGAIQIYMATMHG